MSKRFSVRAISESCVQLCNHGLGTTSPKGDLNHEDAAIALQLAASCGWDPAADVNNDSRITALDAFMILQAAGGSIEL